MTQTLSTLFALLLAVPEHLRTLIVYHELLVSWIRREIKVRYQQSFLGVLWLILQPGVYLMIFSVVFSLFLNVQTRGIPYPVHTQAALMHWFLFANTIYAALSSLTNEAHLISKAYFPREIVIVKVVAIAIIDFAAVLPLFIALLLVYNVPVSPMVVLYPVVLLIQITLITGTALFVSAMNVFYRDVGQFVGLGLQLLLYLTPNFYSVDAVPEVLRPFYWLNPMAVLVESYRNVLLFNTMPMWERLIPTGIACSVLLVAGYTYFKWAERRFVDVL
jgi:lipopolysaccharide transport system permease protein